MARRLWKGLHAAPVQPYPSPWRERRARAGCTVSDVRLTTDGRVHVTYVDQNGRCHGVLAKRAVICCAKHVAKYFIHDLDALDAEKSAAIHELNYRAYAVVNVLLNSPIERDFYDIFLLGDGNLPTNESEAELYSRITDMLNGHYARRQKLPRSVLTLYWPLPFASGRFTLLHESGWMSYAQSAVPQIHAMLAMLEVDASAVVQARMTRWGHAMPIAEVGLIADGTLEAVRRPIEDRIYFVNQDNWALPAVENCLLDAEYFAGLVREGL
jgi:hypothetical protein